MTEANNDSDNVKYNVYLEERKFLLDAKREGSRSFDKYVLTLSGGAFGLSLTFVRQIVPKIIPGTFWLLIAAWAGFTVSILIILISFLTSLHACDRQIQIVEDEFFHKQIDKEKKDKNENRLTSWTNWLNIISILTFMIGIIFLIAFAISNL